MASRADEATLRGRSRAGRAAASRTSAKTLTAGQRWLFVFALLTFGMATSYTAVALLTRITPALFPGKNLQLGVVTQALQQLPGPARVEAPGESSPFNARINILIMGADARPLSQDATGYVAPQQAFPTHTDTIVVATVDPISKKASLLSFPRDLFIEIHDPRYKTPYKSRINNSYQIGVDYGKTFDAGAKQLQTDIEKNFGITIDHYVWVEFKGVERLVESIGGVDVVIPDELQVPHYGGQWYYSDDDVHAHYVSFPPGPAHLNGYNAVAYGRYRDDSDLNRVKRQQVVLEGAVEKVFERGLLANLTDATALWDAYKATVHTDIAKSEILGLANLLRETQGNMVGYSLGDPVNGRPTVWGMTTEDGASVLAWDPVNAQQIIAQAFAGGKYGDSIVEIQNGTGSPAQGEELARGLGRYLQITRRLPTVELGLDVVQQPTTSIILYTEDRRPMAVDIAKWLNLPESAVKTAPKPSSTAPDVVIIIGKDFKLPGT